MTKIHYSLLGQVFEFTPGYKNNTIRDVKKFILEKVKGVQYENIKLVLDESLLGDTYIINDKEYLTMVVVPIKCDIHHKKENYSIHDFDEEWVYID